MNNFQNESGQVKEQSAETSAITQNSPRDIHGWKWFITISCILSTTLLFSLDNTIVADIQPEIVKKFNDVANLSWLGVAFSLGNEVTILPWCKAYGVFNIKWLYIAHVLTFCVGSALCGGAPNMNALIVGRTLCGIGGSGMYAGCLTYVSMTTTIQERPLYMAFIGFIWGLGTVLGPLVGGGFAVSTATWRWAFYLNIVVGAIFAPVYIFLLPSLTLQPSLSFRQRFLRNTDWLGIILFAGAYGCLIMAITFGGTQFPWNGPSEIVLWVVGAVLFCVFCVTQTLHPFVPEAFKLYPTWLNREPVQVALQVLTFCGNICIFVPTYYIPLYFQFVRGDSALKAAVRLLPFITTGVTAALTNGGLMAQLGYYMPWYFGGGLLAVAGSALMYTVKESTSTSAIYGYSVLIGVGGGSFMQAGLAVSQALVTTEQIPDVVGFQSIGQSLAIVLALAISGTIFQNLAYDSLVQLLPNLSGDTVRAMIAGRDSSYFETLDPALKTKIVETIVKAISSVYILVIAAGALTVLISCFLPRTKVFGKETTEQKPQGVLTSPLENHET